MDRLFSKDLWSGLMFAGFGVLALVMGNSLAVGTAIRMGPGYVPRMLSYILIGLGVAQAPALVALIFLSALGGQEFKLIETILACITLTILCIVIFKLGLGMNISIIQGVW